MTNIVQEHGSNADSFILHGLSEDHLTFDLKQISVNESLVFLAHFLLPSNFALPG